MFKRNVNNITDLLQQYLREEGLETPLMQKRLIDCWETVAGKLVARYTTEKYIRNQTLYIRMTNPALRANLSMMRGELVRKLNAYVGSQVIVDIRFF